MILMIFVESIKHAFWSGQQESRNNTIKLFALRFVVVVELLSIFVIAVALYGGLVGEGEQLSNNKYYVCNGTIKDRPELVMVGSFIIIFTYFSIGLFFVWKTSKMVRWRTKSLEHTNTQTAAGSLNVNVGD